MRQIYRSFTLLIFAFALASCAQLGIPKPETFNQKVAVAYATVTQVRTTATQLLEVKKISSDDAANVQISADVARVGIETARKISTLDPKAGDAKLNSVMIALNALANYLATRAGS
jgi:hypothetical protein